jgi:hypothetical protein
VVGVTKIYLHGATSRGETNVIFDIDGFLQSPEFISQVAAFFAAILSAIVNGWVADFFAGV